MNAEQRPALSETLLLWTFLGLIGFGLVMVYSSSGVYAAHRFGDPEHFLWRQAVAAAVATAALLAARNVPYGWWRVLAWPLLVVSLLLLMGVLAFGVQVGGAKRWFRLAGFSFQPSELARYALVVWLAAMLARKGEKIRTFMFGFFPAILITALFGVLIMAQPDLGTSFTLALLTLLLLFAGGGRVGYLLLFVPAGAAALAWLIWSAPYRLERVLAFLNPDAYAKGKAYHLIQSLLALGSGGPWGLGLGMSRQKLGFIPEAHTDFILAIIGEELGLLGVLLLLAGYGLVTAWGFLTAARLADPFGKALALGITLAIGVSAGINMAVVAGLLPTKGLVLPFISYGGSSLIVNGLFAGVLLNLARHAELQEGPAWH